jgi:malate dehydrogenase (oxaloacetate-decarboxylating)
VCIALSKSGPDTIQKEWVASMAPDAVVFMCANPIPEMWPWDAKEAGAAIVATGRSDFPNQVNNSLGFPGIFRGALDVRARTITDEMCIAAAEELAKVAEDKGLSADHIMPTMDDWEVFPREAAAVALKAIEQGIALKKDITFEQEVAQATEIIARARGMVQDAMAAGYIPMPEGSRAPAPTRAAMKAAARGAGEYAGEAVDKAVDAMGPAAQKAADAAQTAADKVAEAIKKATERKKD